MVDISILDRHAFISRNHSPSPVVRKPKGDESPTQPTRLSRINTLQIPRAKLTGPASVADALSKPLPSREEMQWMEATTDMFLDILKRDIQTKTNPKCDLFEVLPFPPLLYGPTQ